MTHICKYVCDALLHLIALERIVLVGEEIQGAIREVGRAVRWIAMMARQGRSHNNTRVSPMKSMRVPVFEKRLAKTHGIDELRALHGGVDRSEALLE
jgi:hypothetical protein